MVNAADAKANGLGRYLSPLSVGVCQGLRRGKTAALAFGVFGRLQRLPVVVPELVRLAARIFPIRRTQVAGNVI